MQVQDARESNEAQEALRYQVVAAVNNGMSKSAAARVFAISGTAAHHWIKAVDERGDHKPIATRKDRR
ncbi:hypothetical protein IFO70_29170 [Phormidium tenue FACHB-886]|nr:hypothetical protein [Phormidium tenue FACHB-886]